MSPTPPTPAAPGESREGKTFCEFFAGIGLVRAGLEPSGWRCVYANDIDPKKHALYRTRFGEAEHFHLGDVWQTERVLERIPGRPFLATASFPCVDLSLCGHYRGLEGEHSSTFFGFARVLQALGDRQPTAVMLENVTGFINSNGGEDFAAVAKALAAHGYWLDAFVLDAAYFVPQSRPRVFIVGVKPGNHPPEAANGKEAWQAALQPGNTLRPPRLVRLVQQVDLPTGWLFHTIPIPPPRRIRLADIIDRDKGQEWWPPDEVARHHRMMSDSHRKQVDELLTQGGLHVGTIYRRVRKGSQKAEVRLDGVAGCLRTPRGGSAKQIVLVIDKGRLRMRWMSPREYARLQGADDFPDGDRMGLLFGFGDAVCVPVIRWIDRYILTPIYDAARHGRGRVA
jgi:DNA (cytosine-5)-methyltransferase 1